MVKQVSFSSNGSNYTATDRDIFMDNGIKIVYIKGGKHSSPTAARIELKPTEWRRIKPALMPIDYESYYGKKPLVNGVQLYQVKV